MKFLSDFFPVLLFVVVYFLGQHNTDVALAVANHYLAGLTRDGVIPPDLASIMLATASALVAISLQILFLLILRKKISMVQRMTFIIFLLFGGATIYFHNDAFIKWKPTVLYWLFALTLGVAQLFFKRNLIRGLMEPNGIRLPTRIWQQINWSWLVFFAALGLINLYIAFNFSRDVWVSFKLFGLTGLTFVFALTQGLLLAKHVEQLPVPETSTENINPNQS